MVDLKKALEMARMSDLVYKPKAEAEARARRLLRCEDAALISRGDTQALIARTPSSIVVAFRGTEVKNINDWGSDAKSLMVKSYVGQVHRGFIAALMDAWDDVQSAINGFQDSAQEIWFTGHSLGGALATLAASMYISRKSQIGGIYTFGQPRVGNQIFGIYYQTAYSAKSFRFVNNNDIVTRLPPRILGYVETGKFLYFNEAGQLFEDGMTKKLFLEAIEGKEKTAIARWNELKRLSLKYKLMDPILDHSISNYIADIVKNI